MIFQRSGFSSEELFSNLALGAFDGIDSALWCYAFATIIFSGLLSVFLPLGLVIVLGGWAFLSIVVALTSKAPVHMVSIDEQAVVIIGSIALLMVESMGAEAATSRGLSTILAVMSITSLLVSLGFYLTARFHLARMLELLPYPVICGFMAGIGWLLFDAGVTVALDVPVSGELLSRLGEGHSLTLIISCLVGGLALFFFTGHCEKAWALPVASLSIVVTFYGFALFSGMDVGDLRAAGWMFDLQSDNRGMGALLGNLSFSQIDLAFIVSVMPQIITVLFLTLLNASMNLSAMSAVIVKQQLNSTDETKVMSLGNLACVLIASPPGFTDAPASILYRGFGATTRWMPLASSLVCLGVAFGGNWLIDYTPRLLIAATIFLFAFQLFYDWMYINVRSFSLLDYAVVCIILMTVVLLGFMQGILIGVIITVLIFVLRYSMINPIQNRYSLGDHRSSVERSAADNLILNQYGSEALVFSLRGFLFFGTANTIRDAIRQQIESGQYSSIMLDLHRVTGIDVSAMNSFVQIRQVCDVYGVDLHYVCDVGDTRHKLLQLQAVGVGASKPYVYQDTDFALENLEQSLLDRYADPENQAGIREHLAQLVRRPEKVQALMDRLERITCQTGEYLFRQGDADNGFYIVESGSMSALLEQADKTAQRLKKFISGSVVGELSAYTNEKTRTASVVANEPTVVYHLDPNKIEDKAVLHELVARTIGIRIDYMNRRLLREMV